jgi:hypothetical protein
MQMLRATALALALAVACSCGARAEQPQTLDSSRLMGTTVYSADGAEIGTITDVRLDDAGRLAEVRIETGVRLGFGARRVQLPGNSLFIVRGAAVVNLPKAAVEMLPTVQDIPSSGEDDD